MTWHTHSSGVQTFLPYFKKLKESTKSYQGKKQFLQEHPNIDLRALRELAYYNYLNEIDEIKILNDRFENNISKYIPRTTIDYLRQFDFSAVEKEYCSYVQLYCNIVLTIWNILLLYIF